MRFLLANQIYSDRCLPFLYSHFLSFISRFPWSPWTFESLRFFLSYIFSHTLAPLSWHINSRAWVWATWGPGSIAFLSVLFLSHLLSHKFHSVLSLFSRDFSSKCYLFVPLENTFRPSCSFNIFSVPPSNFCPLFSLALRAIFLPRILCFLCRRLSP